MRIVARALSSALVVAGLAYCAVSLAGQEGPSDDADTYPAVVCQRTQCLVAGDPVAGAPFTAVATTTWTPPRGSGKPVMRATSRYFRDSAGRVRVEQGYAGMGAKVGQVIVTPEAGGKAYLLDPAARTRSRPFGRGLAEMMSGSGGFGMHHVPLAPGRFVSFHLLHWSPGAGFDEAGASLGERTIAGAAATGAAYTLPLPKNVEGQARVERWTSPGLRVVVFGRSDDPVAGVVEYALSDVRRGEQDPSLFEVPEDYAEQPAPAPATWLNPYWKTFDRP